MYVNAIHTYLILSVHLSMALFLSLALFLSFSISMYFYVLTSHIFYLSFYVLKTMSLCWCLWFQFSTRGFILAFPVFISITSLWETGLHVIHTLYLFSDWTSKDTWKNNSYCSFRIAHPHCSLKNFLIYFLSFLLEFIIFKSKNCYILYVILIPSNGLSCHF